MTAGDIINALTTLNRTTVKEVLDHIGVKLEPGEETAIGKLDMLNLVESTVVDLGIEYFVAKCDAAVIRHLASLFGVPPIGWCIAEQIRCRSMYVFLKQADISLLLEFIRVLGLYKSPNKYSAVAEISDEIIFRGARELINRLSVALLQKLCLELRLIDSQPKGKEYLVNRILCKLDA